MQLHKKLISLSNEQITQELTTLLDQQTRVEISWSGRRMVSFQGYTGTVDIDVLAKKYLDAHQFYSGDTLGLTGKVKYYALQIRIKNLYRLSEEELNKTWIYKAIIHTKEAIKDFIALLNGRLCANTPKNIINGLTRKSSSFEFTPKEFQTLWPEKQPTSLYLRNGAPLFMVSAEMIEEALQRVQHIS